MRNMSPAAPIPIPDFLGPEVEHLCAPQRSSIRTPDMDSSVHCSSVMVCMRCTILRKVFNYAVACREGGSVPPTPHHVFANGVPPLGANTSLRPHFVTMRDAVFSRDLSRHSEERDPKN